MLSCQENKRACHDRAVTFSRRRHVGVELEVPYVWSESYLDALVERDQYSGGAQTQRLYAQQDANYDTTALVDTTGTVQERYLYDPYGVVTVTDASYNPRLERVGARIQPIGPRRHVPIKPDPRGGSHDNAATLPI